MSKERWDRLTDTIKEVHRVLGLEAMNHIAFTVMPRKDTPAADALSDRLSLGKREIFKKSSITKLRHAIRAYILLLILLENRNDGFVQNQLKVIKDNNENLFTLEGRIRQVWKNYNNSLDAQALVKMDAFSGLLQTFRTNPMNFLSQYAVLPYDGDLPQEGNNYDLITMDNSVQKPLILNMALMPSGSIFHTFKLVKAPKTRQHTSVPIYFLPWKSARIVKLTIPPGNQGPKIFFTAGINGCSVFAEGNDTNPTLYHAGITPPWPDMGNTISQYIRNAKAADNVPLVWRELFWNKSTITARNSLNFGEVNRLDYINDGNTVQERPTTLRGLNFFNTINGLTGWRTQNCNVGNFFVWGCVFGIRNNVNWSFYLQENATIFFSHTVGTVTKNYATSRIIRMKKFFPLPVQITVPANYTQAPTNFDAQKNIFPL